MSLWQSFVSALGKLFRPPAPLAPQPPGPRPAGTPLPEPPSPDSVILELLEEHNAFRRDHGVKELAPHEALNRAAQKHASWMALNRSLSHGESPDTAEFDAQDFSLRLKKENYRMASGGENISCGQRDAREAVDAWVNSPPHRANMLEPAYWHAGFGVAQDSLGHLYWCAVLAEPMLTSRLSVALHDAVRVQVLVSLPPALVCGP